MTIQPLIWLHGDCLNPHNPALATYPDAPVVFVFDDELLEQYQISFKRLVFIYECLLEIPNLQIRKGAVVEELALAAITLGCDGIVTVDSVAPRFYQLCRQLRREKKVAVEVMELEPFVQFANDEELDLKRFSRYWQAVSRQAMRLD